MIDWGVAQRVGGGLLGDGGDEEPLPNDLRALAQEAQGRVEAYTGLRVVGNIPGPEAIGRRPWLDANLSSMSALMEPATEKLAGPLEALGPLGGPAKAAAGALLGAEVGAIAGFLGRRVLGQYDLALLDENPRPRLLMVVPNLRGAAGELEVDLEELVTWVGVHEVTHAVQFGAVPWLRPHIGGMLTELLEGIDVDGVDLTTGLKLPSRDDVMAFVGALKSGNLVGMLGGPERAEVLDRVQATMALVEGHAEHVMDAVGADVIEDLPGLRAALTKRRADRSGGPFAWLEKLLGFELKMQQYAVGKTFCDEVVARAGVGALHVAFERPENVPTLAEFASPEQWIERTDVLNV